MTETSTDRVVARLCEPFVLDPRSQQAKLKDAPWAVAKIIFAPDGRGVKQALFCLNVEAVPMLALEHYGRLSKDKALLNHAQRIRLRAVQRMGQLLLEQEKGKPGPKAKANRAVELGAHEGTQSRSQAARAAGISPKQQLQAVRVARVPEPEVSRRVDSDDPPTVTELAKLGTQRKPDAMHVDGDE